MKRLLTAAALALTLAGAALTSTPASAWSFSYGGVSASQPAWNAGPYWQSHDNDNYYYAMLTMTYRGNVILDMWWPPYMGDDWKKATNDNYAYCTGCGVNFDYPYWLNTPVNDNHPA